MTLADKVDLSLELICEHLDRAETPIVMWSGGRDSQVLLWLTRVVDPTLPVFFFREPFQPEKFRFTNEIARVWNLDVRTVTPAAVDLVGQGDFLEILNLIEVAPDTYFYLPTGVNDAQAPTADWECGCEILAKPKARTQEWCWDTAFIGQRDDDVDPLQGAAPLPAVSVMLGPVKLVYPLKHWTEADIWEATRQYFIPQNFNRYEPFDEFREMKDRRANPDYMDICMECLKHGDSETVICPKVGTAVARVGQGVDYEGNAARWRQTFVNIRNESAR